MVGLPQRAGLIGRKSPGHKALQPVLDALPGLADAAVELRSDIAGNIDGAAEVDGRLK